MSPGRLACWAAVAALCATAAGGCGDDAADDGSIKTSNPATTFAPLLRFSRDEPFRPVFGRWFVERSTLRWAPGGGCAHPPVAAGTVVDDLGLVDAQWMFASRLGKSIGYSQRAARGDGCGRGRSYYTNQLTRPYDATAGRAPGLGRDRGFYLDLLDDRRFGPAPTRDGRVATTGGEGLVERRTTRVAGERRLLLTYWMLYGMSRPADATGRPIAAVTHEGDWERAQVVLRAGDERGSWKPLAVRLADDDGGWRQIPWRALRRVPASAGSAATHPELYVARGSHTLYARPGRHRRPAPVGGAAAIVDVAAPACADCARWPMWRGLQPVDIDTWYGFGGAWGEIGRTSRTTGPLGPHGDRWPAGNPSAQLRWRNSHDWGL